MRVEELTTKRWDTPTRELELGSQDCNNNSSTKALVKNNKSRRTFDEREIPTFSQNDSIKGHCTKAFKQVTALFEKNGRRLQVNYAACYLNVTTTNFPFESSRKRKSNENVESVFEIFNRAFFQDSKPVMHAKKPCYKKPLLKSFEADEEPEIQMSKIKKRFSKSFEVDDEPEA